MEYESDGAVKRADEALTIRFGHWSGPGGVERDFFARLISSVSGKSTEIVDDNFRGKVDINIESVYGASSTPELKSRIYRFVHSHLPGGIPFVGGVHTPNQQPSIKAKLNIFFTAENERPPEGVWDLYFSFDSHSFGGRNHYLPLWWITTTDLLFPKVSPWLGKSVTLDELTKVRESNYESREKFCVAFIGKAYPFRMHALTALSKIGKVDVYGELARNSKKSENVTKFEIAKDYKFFFAFENDLYPGYITEKAPEAWATGAIPLYWGLDPNRTLNPDALINLADFSNLDQYVEKVKEVEVSKEKWEAIASQPLLLKKPNLEEIKAALKIALVSSKVL